MKYFMTAIFIMISFTVNVLSQTRDDLWKMNFKKLANGVYAAYHLDPLYLVEGNVLIVINEKDVLVFDGSGAQPVARNIINKIKQLTSNPVSYLIISHGHEDHILGIQEYVKAFPNIEIIARPDTRSYMDTRVRNRLETFEEQQSKNEQHYKDRIAEFETSGNYDPKIIDWYKFTYLTVIPAQRKLYKNIKLQLPTMVFDDDELTLYRDKRTIKIYYLGYGKTQSDLLLYLPEEKILATGDIVTEPIPYGFSKQPDSWLEVLNKIDNIDANIILPGHGKIMYDKSYIRNEIEMVGYINDKVAKFVKAGMNLEEIKKEIDIGKYESKFTGDDPLAKFLFNRWYFQPHVENRFNQLHNN